MDLFYQILAQGGQNPFQVFLYILKNGGFIIFYFVFVWMAWSAWKNWIRNKYLMKKKYVLLAIDVPKDTEQNMKAIEQIMSALHGVHFGPNKKEKHWIGVQLDRFSLEIVSIDGYIQYFVMCDDYNADLVKGAFYAQYPDAEIIEVEDYVQNMPKQFPDDQYEMWGTEFILAKPDYYPIKTYDYFEHSLTGVFADPVASLLEMLSRLRPGEQVWLQLILTPEGIDWRNTGLKEIDSLVGRKVAAKNNRFLDFVGDAPIKALEFAGDNLFSGVGAINSDGSTSSPSKQSSKDDEPTGFMNMTTGEKIIIEEVQKKLARLHFKTKFRFIYIAPKEVANTYRVVGSIFGAIKQFNTLDLNAFRSGRRTVVSLPTYWFVKRRRNYRRNKLMLGYRYRSNWSGERPYVLSTVELATVFHFPNETVRAPLLSSTASKKAEPPTTLPIEQSPFSGLRKGHNKTRLDMNVPINPILPMQQPDPSNLPPDPTGSPLHSMPGLPPGVHAVSHTPEQTDGMGVHQPSYYGVPSAPAPDITVAPAPPQFNAELPQAGRMTPPRYQQPNRQSTGAVLPYVPDPGQNKSTTTAPPSNLPLG